MVDYRQRTKQFILNASKQPIYTCREGVVLFNLNACFMKPNNYARFESYVKESLQNGGTQINLCNLASLCYKLGMNYCSEETYKFVQTLVEIIKIHKVPAVQMHFVSCGESDMQPIEHLISYDKDNNIVYVNQVLVECLKMLGYAEVQIRDLVDYTRDLRNIVPLDLIEELPIQNQQTIKAYKRIKELMSD